MNLPEARRFRLQRITAADTWLLITAVVIIWVGVGLDVLGDHRRARAAAQSNATNLARALAESATRTVREIDQTLRYVRALYARDGAALDLRPWLDSTDPENKLGLQIAITDRNGLVTMSNLRPVTERIDLSDRPHFRHFADHPVDDLFISKPVIGRISKQPSIQFVRMLTTPQSAFDGIVVLSVDPQHLVRLYRSVGADEGERVTLTGLDGVIRADVGGGGATIGIRSPSPAVARAATEQEGDAEWTNPGDGLQQLTHFRRVDGAPLLVEVGTSDREIMAEFRADSRTNVYVGLALSLVVIVLGMVAGWQRRRLARSERTMNAALQNISQGLIMVGPDNRIAVMNHRARELLDIPPTVQVGVPMADLVDWQSSNGEFAPGSPTDVVRQVGDNSRPELATATNYTRTRSNGVVLDVFTQPLGDGSKVRTFTDVTAWKQAQAALTAGRDAAEAGISARAQFLAVMSHEIRTPLNGIIASADLLRRDTWSPKQEGFIRIIQESGDHLLDLVNDILDFTRIEQGRIEIEAITFEPRALLADVVSVLTVRAQARGLHLSSEVDAAVPEHVVGDPHRVRQVLLNLIGNAKKFTTVGGVDVRLTAVPLTEAHKPGGWALACSVRDTGIGMSPEAIKVLFQDFTQVDGSIARRFGGTGLGLAISRRLVEAMGGSIRVESEPGVGSTFSFEIQVGSAAAPDIAAAPPMPPPSMPPSMPPLRVLLAEDNEVNRLVAVAMLEKLGFTVIVVEDGSQALQAVQQGSHDLVIMDVMMPHMDGLAATRAIRLLPGPERRVPILGLTANAFRSDQEACLAAGMDGFVAKPMTLDRLTAAITRVLQLLDSGPAGQPDRAPAIMPVEPAEASDVVMARLTEMLGEATVGRMVAAFCEGVPQQVAEMRAHAAAGDNGRVMRTAHALVGSAATLGFDELATEARALEHGLRAQAVDDVAARLDRVGVLAHRALGSLAAMSQSRAA
jgi:signal transduction histidine kinase/CheY-like chemotaxis protein/HPt (histidine-containing phosphotransfer) domain-containing protein